jgi:uncharacterized protein YceK
MRKRISIIFLLVIVTMVSGCAEIFELGLMTTGSTHLQATAKMPKTESSGYLPRASHLMLGMRGVGYKTRGTHHPL